MKDECLICKAPLVYLEADEEMRCAICGKRFFSKTRCLSGHFVCNDCHMAGLDEIVGLCLSSGSKNPVEIIQAMMAQPFCHMHGPEHHVMVGAALLTAYRNAGGEIELEKALSEMMKRGKGVPGGACGFWGACGAGISSGMFVSIISSSTPLTEEPFALSHQMTAKSLSAIGRIGGPRCCKRDSYLSIEAAIDFVAEHFGVQMEKSEIVCQHAAQNNQCLGKRCPYSKANHTETAEKQNAAPSCSPEEEHSASCCGGRTVVMKKRLRIDYLYLDLHTCDRCIGTDAVLDEVVETLRPALTTAGYAVEYRKTEIETPELAAQYRFLSSPTVLVNGTDIFGEVKESDCGCCGEIAGTDIDCRVFEANGKRYEVPTKEMLANAILKSLNAPPKRREPYVLPENLRRFFDGKAAQNHR